MARLLSNSQIKYLTRNPTRPKFCPPLHLALRHRSNSNRSGDGSNGDGEPPHPQLIEIDLDSSSGGSDDGGGGMRKLEEVIHSVIVRRSAPDWLPFVPGSSYWVPPVPQQPYVKVGSGGGGGLHRCGGDFDAHRIVEVVGKIASVRSHFGSPSLLLASEDDTTSVSRVRGWPSSTYFTGGSVPTFPSSVQVVEVEVKLEDNSDCDSKSEDEEG